MRDDDTTSTLYRLAYGHAARPAGLRGHGATDPRGDRAVIQAEAIRDVVQQHRVRGPAEAIVREAVGDALVGRRPRR